MNKLASFLVGVIIMIIGCSGIQLEANALSAETVYISELRFLFAEDLHYLFLTIDDKAFTGAMVLEVTGYDALDKRGPELFRLKRKSLPPGIQN